MHLVLVNTLSGRNARSIEGLQNDPLVWQNRWLTKLDQARVALGEDEDLGALVFYEAPEYQIGSLLQGGAKPEQAIVAWEDQAEELLSLADKFPGQVTYVCTSGHAFDIEALLDKIEERTGVSLSSGVASIGEEGRESSLPPVVTLAALELTKLTRSAKLLTRLENTGFHLGEKAYVPELVGAVVSAQQRAEQEMSETSKKLSKSLATINSLRRQSEEHKSVMRQLFSTQDKLDSVMQKNAALSKSNASLRVGRDYRKTKIVALENKLEALRRGRRSRRNEITELRRELETRDSKIRWLQSVREEHRNAARTLRAQLREVENQLSAAQVAEEEVEDSTPGSYRGYLKRLRGGQHSPSWFSKSQQSSAGHGTNAQHQGDSDE